MGTSPGPSHSTSSAVTPRLGMLMSYNTPWPSIWSRSPWSSMNSPTSHPRSWRLPPFSSASEFLSHSLDTNTSALFYLQHERVVAAGLQVIPGHPPGRGQQVAGGSHKIYVEEVHESWRIS